MNPGQENYAKNKSGSPYYMAPELFQDDGVYSFSSDLWSFGCLLFEFLTGKVPFNSNSLNKLMKMIQDDPPPLNMLNISKDLLSIISLCLEKDPSKRITWDELLNNPYWVFQGKELFDSLILPQEPQFEEYLAKYGKKKKILEIEKKPDFKRETEQDRLLNDKAALLAKQLSINPSSKIDVLRLSYNVKKNIENTNHEEIEIKGDDVQMNNHNIELDFADEGEETEEPSQIDEYLTPVERQANDPVIKITSKLTEANIEKPMKLFERVDTNTTETKLPIEVDEFYSDLDDKVKKNMMQIDKREFKHLSNINTTVKQKKITTAHSDVDAQAIDYKFFNTEPENNDEKEMIKPSLNKINSNPPITKKVDTFVVNALKNSDKKQPNVPTGGVIINKYSQITKSKSMKEPQNQATKEAVKSPNVIKFYPPQPVSADSVSPPGKKEKAQIKETPIATQMSVKQSSVPQKKTAPKPLEQLMIHHSDTTVKPIIGNKEIEKTQEPVFKESYLTFTPWSAEEFEQKIESQDIENYLTEIYQCIVNNTNLTEKVHALSYFESIITNSSVSNRLINSAFLTLFVHFLEKSNRSHMVKIRICSIIGLLIRHATVIENEVAESGICKILCQTLEDSKENVKRKAIAALGEYLFYAATQLDDDQASNIWKIPEEAVTSILKCMKPYEDEIVKFYACKTIENITAQSMSAGHLFATTATCKCLLDAFLNSNKESYIITAAVALSHICKLNPSLFNYVIEYIPLEDICRVLTESQSRIQQAFITMINIALLHKNESLFKMVNENYDSLSKAVINLLENQSLVIRGKSILTAVLLLKHFPLQWFTIFISDKKFITLLDRLAKDNYKYVQYGLLHFLDQIEQTMPIIFSVIEEDLEIAINMGNTSDLEIDVIVEQIMERRMDFKNLKGHMTLTSLILAATSSHLMKSRIVNENFLESISHMLNISESMLFLGADEFINAVLAIIESISGNQKTLYNYCIPVLQSVIPVLMNKLRSDSNDVKFLSLKIFTDITIQYINNDSIFDVSKLDALIDDPNLINRIDGNCKRSTELMSEILVNGLLPNFKRILDDTDPIPLFGLKLLSALADRSCEFINTIEKSGMFPLIAEFYCMGHKRLNRHTIKIIKCFIESHETSLDSLYHYLIIDNTLTIIDNMLEQNQDWCFDLMTEALYSIIEKVSSYVELQENIDSDINLEKAIESLTGSVFSLIELLSPNYESNVVEKSSQCLISILTKFANKHKGDMYLTEDHFKTMIQSLQNSTNTAIQTRIIQSVSWFLSYTNSNNLSRSRKINLIKMLEQDFILSQDHNLIIAARDLYRILQAIIY